jgi:hypothetical protein
MDPLQFAAGEVMLLFAGGAVDIFHRAYERPFREPAAWIGVIVEPARQEQIKVTIGRTDQPTDPVYRADGRLDADLMFELDAIQEPGLRAFFAEVARASGRV